ncbi:MAG: hypothetical protein V3W20_08470 [Candidatus Neomarinimicrobiota bacterium]
MAHLPTNSLNLTVEETLNIVEQQGKFTQDEATYIPEANNLVCGTCRFFMRSEFGTVGQCQVVEGDINWNGTSDYYISAKEEAEASLMGDNAYLEDDEKEKRGMRNKFNLFIERTKNAFNDLLPVEQTIVIKKNDVEKRIDEMLSPERAMSFEIIREQAFNLTFENGWLIDVFEDDGRMYALLSSGGHLLRQQLGIVNDTVELAGDPFRVAVEHRPIQTRTTITRQKDGKYRWFSISATSVLNRQGEIDSRDLFDSFVAHIEKTGEYPIRQFYHQGPQFRTGQSDFVARDDNCLITSGLFDNTSLAKMEIEARQREPDYWGESIGFKSRNLPEMFEVQESVNIPVYNTGILIEISTLPEDEAASLFTVTQQREVNQMLKDLPEKVRAAFIKGFEGDENAANQWFIDNPDELNRSIQDGGLITRDKDEKPIEGISLEIKDNKDLEDLVIRQGKQMIDMVNSVTTLIENQTKMIEQMTGFEERFTQVEKTQVSRTREAIQDMPSVPQVKSYNGYVPRQLAQESTYAERANSITPAFGGQN